ncbi:MAG: SDR family oxidoreductase [Lachnospiraceae bacterium]|nr:SDR family oxidoreductase [Lachnospiraceae bacterium]
MILKDRNVIITGANGGIGRAVVYKIAENGGNIWACARTKTAQFEQDLQKTADQYGVWIEPVYFDMADENQIKNAVKEISKEKKCIDALVNCAGIVYNGTFTMTSVNKLKEVFEINYFAQIYMMQLISRIMMRQKKGSIVNVASVSGIETTEGKLAYGSSKAALIYASKAISKELATYNIRVNALAPGLTDTEMNKVISETDLQKVLDRSSMKRMAAPEEIANAVLFLASDQSSFMTGQVMVVDGGRLWS